MGGIDQVAAYERFGLDMVLYTGPDYMFDEAQAKMILLSPAE